MLYKNAKISFDGSHYIATPQETFPHRKRWRPQREKTEQEIKQIAQFELAYEECKQLPRKKRKDYLERALQDTLADEETCKHFIEKNTERKRINAIRRKVRLSKKVRLQHWNYFCTFTYDSKKHTEESFQKSLRNTLKHLVNRKGWKHIGAWERGGDTNRLHFHGIFYIPPKGMIGTLIQTRDYSTTDHRMQTTTQNTHFLNMFGRNDFQQINTQNEVQQSLRYLMKYIEKSGGKLVYGGKLPTYFISDIDENDIVCPCGIDNRKRLLFDDFTCYRDGKPVGKVSPEVIEKMPKAN